MSDDIKVAVKHAVEKQHLKQGSEVSNDAAMTMMNDIWREVYAKQHKYTDAPVSAAAMQSAAKELSTQLHKYGVKDIVFYDSNNDGKADKNDLVDVKKGLVFGNSEYKLAERPSEKGRMPTNFSVVPEYNKDPLDIKIPGY